MRLLFEWALFVFDMCAMSSFVGVCVVLFACLLSLFRGFLLVVLFFGVLFVLFVARWRFIGFFGFWFVWFSLLVLLFF